MTPDELPEVADLLAHARAPRPAGDPFAAPAIRDLLQRARLVDADERASLVRAILPGLEVDDPLQAGVVAMLCGTLVEWGADVEVAGAAIVARLARAAADPEPEPQALRFLGLAAMAHLCRDVDLRQRVRDEPGLVAALEPARELAAEVDFVLQVLGFVDDLMVLVIAAEARRAYLVRAHSVHTNFHLFTLLQGALTGDPASGWLAGPAYDPELWAVATGEVPHVRLLHDEQRFHFHDLGAITREGLHLDMSSTIWGEGSPRALPTRGGRAVVVLGPRIFGGRSWDSNFFANIHDALRSPVEVLQTYAGEEFDRLLRELGDG